ncbi:family 43 glycosylhydrolase [Microbacterium murale]|uniref:beta-fructofuranosidase n=1 Tax=Microbacterium murale TaxID=1081040 RepID=A0ABQ1S480_9MICO|nr:family 43 glycosylhydrolase [Microbacterium murale]GGD89018.1 beta-fructofuranosidase [Microbacterium murale]
MPEVYYQHPDTWFGDCMPIHHDGAFYLFHQRDLRNPGPLPNCEPFGWALARTTDFVTYEDLGDVIIRGGDHDQDQFIFAGSVIRANDKFVAMYTGYNRDHFEAAGKPSQVLMIAESDDLVHWTKTDKAIVAPQPGYDADDWRDPWVIWDNERGEYLMILGARKAGPKTQATGSTVAFTSKDLENWEFQGDFWAPGLYTMHEMPDLFQEGDWWYHLVTEYSDKSKTVYRRSRSLQGPWEATPDDAFDARAYYAARSVSDGTHRYLVGWVPTRWDDDDTKGWQWGGTLVIHEIVVRTDGTLGTKVPDSVAAHLASRIVDAVPAFRLERRDGVTERVLAAQVPQTALVSTTLRVDPGTRVVNIRFGEDPVAQAGYQFALRPTEGRLEFDRFPNWPWGQFDNRDLDRPLAIDDGAEHTVALVFDGDIATLYIDDVALNTRFNTPAGSQLTIDVVDGGIDVGDVVITTIP